MANLIYIPYGNPVRFYEYDKVPLPQYESRHIDDYIFRDQLMDWNTRADYKQKWLKADSFPLQFESTFSGIQIQVIDCEENVLLTQTATQVRKNLKIPDMYVYQSTISWDDFDPGTYFIKLTLGGTKIMISEPQEVFLSLPNSLLFQWSNSKFHGDIVFETGITMKVRFEGCLLPDNPGNERTGYIDQRYNPTTLKSIPYRTYNLIIEKDFGAPAWVGDMLNWIFSCDNVTIDGKPYAITDANIESDQLDPQYPMKTYSVKVQDGINRSSKIVGVDVDPNRRLLITHVIDATIFHDVYADAGSNLIIVEGIE